MGLLRPYGFGGHWNQDCVSIKTRSRPCVLAEICGEFEASSRATPRPLSREFHMGAQGHEPFQVSNR